MIHHTAGLVLGCGAAQAGYGDHRVDIRMDHRASARRRWLIGAGATDQGPYPTFLAIGGALITFVPSSPSWTLEPDLALALFVAPVLLDAAYDTSLRDLRNKWVPVSTLVGAAVGLTTAGVAFVAG